MSRVWGWFGVAWCVVLSLWVNRAFETGHPVIAALLVFAIVPLVFLSLLAVLDS